jgi:alpha-tubulin suppressor-like RCC1 family protein
LTDRYAPALVDSDGTWTSVSSGYRHTCGVKTDGSAWCWGWNIHGELGIGKTHRPFETTTPAQVRGSGQWSQITTGYEFTCGVQNDGTLWCWGKGYQGALGQGDQDTALIPTQVGTGTSWAQVSAAYFHSCATTTDGALYCWGLNDDGELGDGTTETRYSPVQIGKSRAWFQPTAGFRFACANRANGTAWCWGANFDGQLGDGTTNNSLVPVKVVKN